MPDFVAAVPAIVAVSNPQPTAPPLIASACLQEPFCTSCRRWSPGENTWAFRPLNKGDRRRLLQLMLLDKQPATLAMLRDSMARRGPHKMRQEKIRNFGADRGMADHVTFREPYRHKPGVMLVSTEWGQQHYDMLLMAKTSRPAGLPVRTVVEGSQEYELIFGEVPIRLTRFTGTYEAPRRKTARGKTAERASVAELLHWEEQIEIALAADPDLRPYIKPQSRIHGHLDLPGEISQGGHLPGDKLSETRHTTHGKSKKQLEREAKGNQIGVQKLRKMLDIMTVEELVNTEAFITMTMCFGATAADVGARIGKGKEAMNKIRMRMIAPAPNRFGASHQKAFAEAMADEARGWFLLIKMERRPSQMFLVDVDEHCSAEAMAQAVNHSMRAESKRIYSSELHRIGRKLLDEAGHLNAQALEIIETTRLRVRRAFVAGHLVGSFDGEPCDPPPTNIANWRSFL
jgi:hypothetical protein